MSKIREGAWRCRDGFAAQMNGSMAVIPAGALVPYDYPYELLDRYAGQFDNISHPRGHAPPVEQASAAPGENRTLRKPKQA